MSIIMKTEIKQIYKIPHQSAIRRIHMFKLIKNIFFTVDLGKVICYTLGTISLLILLSFFIGFSAGLVTFG